MDRTVLHLDGAWRLSFLDNGEVKKLKALPTTGREARKIGRTLDATVPGDFYRELERAGIEPDPFFGDNSWGYQKYEYTHVWYAREFTLAEKPTDRLYFDFEGLDTVAEIYCNGRLIGQTDNMFIPHEIEAKGLKKGRNELLVHFIPAMLAARRERLPEMCHTLFYSFEALRIRKAMHSFGWDIMPRLVSCGIWKSVSLRERALDAIDELHLFTLSVKPEEQTARVRIYFALRLAADSPREYRLEIDGKCGDSTFHEEVCPHHTEYTRLAFTLKNAHYWWPKGHGKPELYDVTARLWHGDTLVDTKTMRVGIRSAVLSRTDAIREDGGDFTFTVNGRRIFCMGTNFVPLSPFPCENAEKLPQALALLDESNSNMVRVWGGGVYPDDAFFDYCDEHGIMVWQDFMMACAVYPQDEAFCDAIRTEAAAVVKRLRHHASLVLWAGDNECDVCCEGWNGYRRDPNDNILTRKILPEVVRTHDFTRDYLPSSPYVSRESFLAHLPTPEAHLWDSGRTSFEKPFYRDATCYFASEIGFHGCPPVSSLRRFIGEDHLYPIENEAGEIDRHWLAHTCEAQEDGELSYRYRAKLHEGAVKHYFGSLPDDIETYATLSQIIQGEALKTFVESFRAKKWRRTGILWWNLLDGWPQVSDAAVDWYGEKKRSFTYLCRVQTPVALMLSLPTDGKAEIVAANDTGEDREITFTVRSITKKTVLAEGKTVLPANENAVPGTVPCSADEYEMIGIEWTENGETRHNHFCTRLAGADPDTYLREVAETF